MRCEECGQRPATVHVTRVVNGQATSRHLCERCAREQGELEPFWGWEPKFGLPDLLSGFFEYPGRRRHAVCRRCGLSYGEFVRSGLLGCATCYESFAAELEPVLRRVQGSTRHAGKVPRRAPARAASPAAQLEELRRQLEAAIREERYEDAARIRDRIRALERQAGQGPAS